jgi:hypothetical protein
MIMRCGQKDTTMGWERLGALFATADDHEQAAFFKSMVAEMAAWDTALQGEYQLAAVWSLLTAEERERLTMLGAPE